MKYSRDDLALYASGNYEGDLDALEAALAADEGLRAALAEEARLEEILRDAAAAATFCPACAELVRAQRCDACGAAIAPGGYRVERVLVANAHGRMYVARDADGKQVALKELAFVQSPGAQAVAAFERETRFLRALAHPAIPRFLASFEEGDGVHTRYYLAQELVAGEALDARLDGHFYGETEIVEIATQVLRVLVYLQGLSPMVIHRDIKPANLLRRADGSIALVDFGAAHVQGTTVGSTSIGTFGYMPIEQLAGQVDATTDLYALGATLVHLLTRQEPWRVMTADLVGTINVSAPLRRFLARLVAPRREDRLPSAAAALAALERPATLGAASPPRRWRQLALGAAAIAGLAGAGAAGFVLRGSREETSREPPAIATAGPWATPTTLPPVCLAYAMEAGNLASCRDLPSDKLVTLTAPFAALTRDDVHSERAYAERTLACASLLDELRQETAACRSYQYAWSDVPPVPVPPVPPVPLVPLAPLTPRTAFTNNKKIATTFRAKPIVEVLRFFAKACEASIVVPHSLDTPVSLELADASCDQALETFLESHGLWYRYEPAGNVIVVYPRLELERLEADEREGRGHVDPSDLPDAPLVDLDLENASVLDVLARLTKEAKVNLFVPSPPTARVSVHLRRVPWSVAMTSVLASNGLGFRYRAAGRFLRVAPRRELAVQDAAERERAGDR